MGKRLIVGLGNPGAEYEGTRHNAGFMVADALAARCRLGLVPDGEALVGWGSHRGCAFGLAKPQAYMNRSGDAVRRLARAHGLGAAEILVVVDDLHLDVGAVRLRAGGGAGGHNGLEHVAERLGTTDFPRLRLGIGRDFPRGGQVDYVLAPFAPQQRAALEDALITACNAALAFVADGIEAAMNRYN